MASHTPGPYRVGCSSLNKSEVVCTDYRNPVAGGNMTGENWTRNGGAKVICHVQYTSWRGPKQAVKDAHLLAAAPDLLAALIDAIEQLEFSGYCHDHPGLSMGRAAIAKTKGAQS